MDEPIANMEDAFPEYKFSVEPTTLECGHILAYTCPHCKECYQCKHKVLGHGDGSLWWRCRNGSKHKAVGDTQVKA